jgi:hypothetical protein
MDRSSLFLLREIYREIVSWVIPQRCNTPIEPGNVFDNESSSYPSVDFACPNFDDVSQLSMVSTAFRELVKEMSMGSVVVRDSRELAFYVDLVLEDAGEESTRKAGDRCKSLEVCIEDAYDPLAVARLLAHTPNLSVFLLRTAQSTKRVGLLPRSILDAVLKSCLRLRCLYLDSFAESPSFFNLLEVTDRLKCLHTLHIRSIHSYPDVSRFFTDHTSLRWSFAIRVLSLGYVGCFISTNSPGSSSGWDKLLTLLSSTSIGLPNIQRLDTAVFPSTLFFFQKYGRSLRVLLTASRCSEFTLSPALELCTCLESLILQVCEEAPHLPRELPSLKRICIAPCYDGPSKGSRVVMRPYLMDCINEFFHSLQSVGIRQLEEIRVRNAGELELLTPEHEGLREWSRVWRMKGVRMVDREGLSVWDSEG